MEKFTIKGKLIFEYQDIMQWGESTTDFSNPKYGPLVVCVDRNNNRCITGSDFIRARNSNGFPVKVYSI